jgi:hypothetical protein
MEGKEIPSQTRAHRAAGMRTRLSTSLRGALLSAEARLRAKADATKQSILSIRRAMDCFRLRSSSYGGQVASLAMTVGLFEN